MAVLLVVFPLLGMLGVATCCGGMMGMGNMLGYVSGLDASGDRSRRRPNRGTRPRREPNLIGGSDP